MDLLFAVGPIVTLISWCMVLAFLPYVDAKRVQKQETKERRYLEAVAMLTAEEKREIGIE